jgi:hypothetical protein
MKLRDFVVRATMVSLIMISMNADAFADDDDEAARTAKLYSLLAQVPSSLIAKDRTMSSAYYDTVSILIEDNRCSNFYGGSAAAIDVLNRLFERAKKDYLPAPIGMRMSGGLISMLNAETNTSYRMFEKISINKNGPFYKRKTSSTQPLTPGIGSFEADTREVRVLMLLHELAHLMKGADGNWLLPDDGRDQDISVRNSKKIEAVCGDKIRELEKTNAGEHLAKLAAARNKLALAGKEPGRKDQLKEE